jgi:hypothetical protein
MSKELTNEIDGETKTDITKTEKTKTLKYKTLILNGIVIPETKSSTDLSELDKFLENEKISNSGEPWSKLDKTAKIRKLTAFAENYRDEQKLSDDEYNKLIVFFRECLDKKRLQRVKDVSYDKATGEIKDIPALFFNKPSNHFTLKNIDKRTSTLKGLTPKKKQGTAKNIKQQDSESDEEVNYSEQKEK